MLQLVTLTLSALLLSRLVAFRIEANELEQEERKKELEQETNPVSRAPLAEDCSFAALDPYAGWLCSSDRSISGGAWGDTRRAKVTKVRSKTVLDVVLKVASQKMRDGGALLLLKNEEAVAKLLSNNGFAAMPTYHFDFPVQPAAQGSVGVLMVDFLEGYKDIQGPSSWVQGEKPFIREVRAASLLLAYNELMTRGVSHCDLNSGNVMFKVNDPRVMKIIDYGLSEMNPPGGNGMCSPAEDFTPFFFREHDLGSGGLLWQLYQKISTMEAGNAWIPVCKMCDATNWPCIVDHCQKLHGLFEVNSTLT